MNLSRYELQLLLVSLGTRILEVEGLIAGVRQPEKCRTYIALHTKNLEELRTLKVKVTDAFKAAHEERKVG